MAMICKLTIFTSLSACTLNLPGFQGSLNLHAANHNSSDTSKNQHLRQANEGVQSRHLEPVVGTGDIVGVGLVCMPVSEVLVGRAVLRRQETMEAAQPSHKPAHKQCHLCNAPQTTYCLHAHRKSKSHSAVKHRFWSSMTDDGAVLGTRVSSEESIGP